MEKLVTLKKKKRARKHGFRKRMSSHNGRKTVKRRRLKNRSSLSL